MGKDSVTAAMDAASEVIRPMFGSTMVIVVVFTPIIFLSGVSKYLFTSLALSVTFSMLASFLVSVTLIPIMAAALFRNYLPNAEGQERRKSIFERFFDRVSALYERLLAFFLGMRLLTLGAAFGLLAVAILMAGGLGFELFPKMDVGQVEIYARFEPGTRLEVSEKYIAGIEESIRDVAGEELNMLVSNIGVFYDWPAAYTPNSGTQDAFLKVQLKENHARSTFDLVGELRKRLNTDFPGVEFSFNTGGIVTAALNYGLSSPIDIQIRGDKLEKANEIAAQIRDRVRQIPGTRDVRILQRINQPQLDIDIDRVKAAEMGLHAEDVVKNVVAGLNSSTTFAKSFWIDERNGNHYFVGVTYPEHLIDDENMIENVQISSETQGKSVPVRNFAKIRHSSAPTEVNHLNLTRVTDVHVNVEGRDIGHVATEVQEALDAMDFPKGYEVKIRGEIEIMQNAFADLGLGLGL
ncbi:MAG: efflux RND transporter permease subunit, partial [Bacteroidota bacterium]